MKPTMSFSEAVRLGFSRMFSFQGRSRRSEFWWFYLLIVIIEIMIATLVVLNFRDNRESLDSAKLFLQFVFWIPILGVSVRRLHDSGKSGLWLLLALTGIGSIVLLMMFCLDSERGENKYGLSPKYSDEDDGSNPNPTDNPNHFNEFNQSGVQF